MTYQLVVLTFYTLSRNLWDFYRKFRATPRQSAEVHQFPKVSGSCPEVPTFRKEPLLFHIWGYLYSLVSQWYSSSSLHWNNSFCSPLTQALTPTYLNPNPTRAFKCGVIPCEKKQIQSPSCVLEHLMNPYLLGGSFTLGAWLLDG
jgi:hypothetical protein